MFGKGYDCFPHAKEKCIKFDLIDTKYKTLDECESKCFTEEEHKILEKPRQTIAATKIKKFLSNKLIDFIHPSVSNVEKDIKEIPLLSYNYINDDENEINLKPFSGDIFTGHEFRIMYMANASYKDKKYNDNFILDLCNSFNSLYGEGVEININPKQNRSEDEKKNMFFDEEAIKKITGEINKMINENKNFLVKRITLIFPTNGHAAVLLFQKKGENINIFTYDPTYEKNMKILYENILGNLKSQLAKKFDGFQVNTINLSRIYGLQNYEIINLEENLMFDLQTSEFQHEMNDAYKKLLNFFTKNYQNVYDKILGKELKDEINNKVKAEIKKELFADIKENTIFSNVIDNYIDDWINMNESYDRKLRSCSNTPFMLPTGDLVKKVGDIYDKILRINEERKKIVEEVYEKFNITFFQALCYIWSSYTITTIIINPNIDVYDIIKYNFYQTSRKNEMETIFKNYKLDTMDRTGFFNINLSKISEEGFVSNALDNLRKNRDSIIEKLSNTTLIKHQKLIYTKILNFLTLSTKYNLLKNPQYIEMSQYSKEQGMSIYDTNFLKYDMYEEKSVLQKLKERKENIESKTEEASQNIENKMKKIQYELPYNSETPMNIMRSLKMGETSVSLYKKIIIYDFALAKKMKQAGGNYKNKYYKYELKKKNINSI
jgi:hypothetical protein